LLEKKPARLVSVALANKTARVVWAVLSKQEVYKPYRVFERLETHGARVARAIDVMMTFAVAAGTPRGIARA